MQRKLTVENLSTKKVNRTSFCEEVQMDAIFYNKEFLQ